MIVLTKRSYGSIWFTTAIQLFVFACVIGATVYEWEFAGNLVKFWAVTNLFLSMLWAFIVVMAMVSTSAVNIQRRSLIKRVITVITTPIEMVLLAGTGWFLSAFLFFAAWIIGEIAWVSANTDAAQHKESR